MAKSECEPQVVDVDWMFACQSEGRRLPPPKIFQPPVKPPVEVQPKKDTNSFDFLKCYTSPYAAKTRAEMQKAADNSITASGQKIKRKLIFQKQLFVFNGFDETLVIFPTNVVGTHFYLFLQEESLTQIVIAHGGAVAGGADKLM